MQCDDKIAPYRSHCAMLGKIVRSGEIPIMKLCGHNLSMNFEIIFEFYPT